MREDGESGYQSNGYWNKYAKRLDECDFFAGCGKKNGAVDFCAIAYCYWLFLKVVTDEGEPSNDDRKYMVHWAMYQSDACCTSAGCEQQVQAYKNGGAWYEDPQDLVIGAQIFFQMWDDDKGRMVYYHTGGCYDWDNEGCYVTEANVSGGKTENRFYPFSEFGNKIAGFGLPRFDGYEQDTEPEPEPTPDPEPEPSGTVEIEMDILKKGDTGNQVETLQILLNAFGFRDDDGNLLEVDSIFGEKTKQAVISYQSARDIEADGVVGFQTWSHILK